MYSHEVWIVCRGVVQLSTIHRSGDEILTGFAFPGMPFGAPLTALDPYQAQALSEVDLMRFTLVELQRSPELSQRLLNQVNRRLQQAETLIALISQKRVEERLRQILMLLKREIGQPVEGGTRIAVRLTHQHLANAINSTRVTVTRALGQLQEEGWLFVDRNRYIVITDKEK
jgi:CRP-like cAMP-binding protein